MTIHLLWVNYADEDADAVYTLVLAADSQLLADDPDWWGAQLAQLAEDGVLDHPHRVQELPVDQGTLATLFTRPAGPPAT